MLKYKNLDVVLKDMGVPSIGRLLVSANNQQKNTGPMVSIKANKLMYQKLCVS